MKKNSRKGRRLQKEKMERIAATRAKMKVGKPFSKVRKIHCSHYGSQFLGVFYSHLIPYGEQECVCTKCGAVLPIEEYEKMKRINEYLVV